MTFYWWSHWFWITLFSNVLFFITFVHTYPSQEISLELNLNSGTQKMVTKLHQTTAFITWTTVMPPPVTTEATISTQKLPVPVEVLEQERTKLKSVSPALLEDDMGGGITSAKIAVSCNENRRHDEDYEFKRSAENYNQTNKDAELIPSGSGNVSAIDVGESRSSRHGDTDFNNYTNFSSSTNITNPNNNNNNITMANATLTTTMVPSAAAPAAPKIENTHPAQDWISTMRHQRPQASETSSHELDNEAPAAGKKIPFTLENVNKEDELRRAENEHRSRKSKVLSAEYRHIDRFINYSTDSKSLLTRSASTAPNRFDGDDDESNISSEALAIKRTYFLDAGAISAICFIVFGVCCTVGTIGIVLYRRRYLNKPQTLSEPDSSVYIDDSTIRDNSDEMYSLDNDSFLNSLEAMTIQNYWTDTVKHTKL